jgi:hypothetical protein
VTGVVPHGAGYATRRDVVVHFARNNRSALNSDREWHRWRQYADLFAVRGLVAVLRDHRTVGPMNGFVVSGLVRRRAGASPIEGASQTVIAAIYLPHHRGAAQAAASLSRLQKVLASGFDLLTNDLG